MIATNPMPISEFDAVNPSVTRFRSQVAQGSSDVVLIDFSRCTRTSTSALAALIQLRRALLREGRELRLVGLHGPAAAMHEICRLSGVLPAAA